MTTKSSSRLLSLDVFRGITIAGAILVNSPGNQTAYGPLEHAVWDGCTPTDLVFPFFLFIVGVSLVFSFFKRAQQGQGTEDLLGQIFKRTAIIFGLGLLLNGFPYDHLEAIRVPGVLQRIALCYFIAALLYLYLKPKVLVVLTAGILIGYWLLLTRVSVPGFGPGVLTKEGNLPAFVDRLVFHGHMYTPDYDPEGILSTLTAVATTLLGVLTGVWLLRDGITRGQKTAGLLVTGLVSLALGGIWSFWFPMNKALWTSSFVLLTGGAAWIILALCYWLIEIKGFRAWSRFFEIFGVNAIAAYFFSIFDLKIQNRIRLTDFDGTAVNLRIFITNHLFGAWASPPSASMMYAVSHTLIWFFILSYFYKKRIFIKV